MASLRNKQKLVIVASYEEHPTNYQSRDTSVHRINEEYITEISKEIENRVTKNCPRNSTGQSPACRVLYLDEFFGAHMYGHNPEPFTEHLGTQEIQEANGNRSQNDPHSKMGVLGLPAPSIS